jgi:hypothetical protein
MALALLMPKLGFRGGTADGLPKAAVLGYTRFGSVTGMFSKAHFAAETSYKLYGSIMLSRKTTEDSS